MKERSGGYALVAVAACSWGTWPLILRRAPMPAALQSAVTLGMLTLVSLPLMLRDRGPDKAALRHWLVVGWLGISDALNVALFFAAYQRTTVAIAVLTHYLTPIFVALAAPFVTREEARARTFVAVAIAFLGLAVLLEPWRASLGAGDLAGAALGAGSAVFYASNVLFTKRLAPAFSGSELMFFHGLVATPLLFAFVPVSDYGAVSGRALAFVLGGALGPGALGGLLFVWGLRRVTASHAAVLTLLEPLVAVALATVLLGEHLGRSQVFGGVLILLGAGIVIGVRRDVPDEVT